MTLDFTASTLESAGLLGLNGEDLRAMMHEFDPPSQAAELLSTSSLTPLDPDLQEQVSEGMKSASKSYNTVSSAVKNAISLLNFEANALLTRTTEYYPVVESNAKSLATHLAKLANDETTLENKIIDVKKEHKDEIADLEADLDAKNKALQAEKNKLGKLQLEAYNSDKADLEKAIAKAKSSGADTSDMELALAGLQVTVDSSIFNRIALLEKEFEGLQNFISEQIDTQDEKEQELQNSLKRVRDDREDTEAELAKYELALENMVVVVEVLNQLISGDVKKLVKQLDSLELPESSAPLQFNTNKPGSYAAQQVGEYCDMIRGLLEQDPSLLLDSTVRELVQLKHEIDEKTALLKIDPKSEIDGNQLTLDNSRSIEVALDTLKTVVNAYLTSLSNIKFEFVPPIVNALTRSLDATNAAQGKATASKDILSEHAELLNDRVEKYEIDIRNVNGKIASHTSVLNPEQIGQIGHNSLPENYKLELSVLHALLTRLDGLITDKELASMNKPANTLTVAPTSTLALPANSRAASHMDWEDHSANRSLASSPAAQEMSLADELMAFSGDDFSADNFMGDVELIAERAATKGFNFTPAESTAHVKKPTALASRAQSPAQMGPIPIITESDADETAAPAKSSASVIDVEVQEMLPAVVMNKQEQQAAEFKATLPEEQHYEAQVLTGEPLKAQHEKGKASPDTMLDDEVENEYKGSEEGDAKNNGLIAEETLLAEVLKERAPESEEEDNESAPDEHEAAPEEDEEDNVLAPVDHDEEMLPEDILDEEDSDYGLGSADERDDDPIEHLSATTATAAYVKPDLLPVDIDSILSMLAPVAGHAQAVKKASYAKAANKDGTHSAETINLGGSARKVAPGLDPEEGNIVPPAGSRRLLTKRESNDSGLGDTSLSPSPTLMDFDPTRSVYGTPDTGHRTPLHDLSNLTYEDITRILNAGTSGIKLPHDGKENDAYSADKAFARGMEYLSRLSHAAISSHETPYTTGALGGTTPDHRHSASDMSSAKTDDPMQTKPFTNTRRRLADTFMVGVGNN